MDDQLVCQRFGHVFISERGNVYVGGVGKSKGLFYSRHDYSVRYFCCGDRSRCIKRSADQPHNYNFVIDRDGNYPACTVSVEEKIAETYHSAGRVVILYVYDVRVRKNRDTRQIDNQRDRHRRKSLRIQRDGTIYGHIVKFGYTGEQVFFGVGCKFSRGGGQYKEQHRT